jgi:hypothetical protein
MINKCSIVNFNATRVDSNAHVDVILVVSASEGITKIRTHKARTKCEPDFSNALAQRLYMAYKIDTTFRIIVHSKVPSNYTIQILRCFHKYMNYPNLCTPLLHYVTKHLFLFLEKVIP